jgi:hypothetical protein
MRLEEVAMVYRDFRMMVVDYRRRLAASSPPIYAMNDALNTWRRDVLDAWLRMRRPPGPGQPSSKTPRPTSSRTGGTPWP